MTLRLITPPATLPITVEQVKKNLNIDHILDIDDELIEGMIWEALDYIETSTGQPFEPQTWEMVIDAFPAAEIKIPLGPVVSVATVKYDDADGVEQTVDSADYEVDTVSKDGWVVPSGTWPTAMATINAVRIQFVVGSGAPRKVKRAMHLLVGHYYANREAVSQGKAEVPLGVEANISLHRRIYI